MIFYFKSLKLKKGIIFKKENIGYFLKGPIGCSLCIPYNKDINIDFDESINLLKIRSSYLSKIKLYEKLFFQKSRGVLYGYKKKLKLKGIGYTSEVLKNNLILKLGFSSPVRIKIPLTMRVKIKKRKIIKIFGSDLNEITQFASKIRSKRSPEIYKGKGILYFKEKIFLKIGKKN